MIRSMARAAICSLDDNRTIEAVLMPEEAGTRSASPARSVVRSIASFA